MKKLILSIFIISSTFGFSQDAKSLLDEVSEKVKSYDNIYIEFEHKFDNVEANMHQATNGSATLQGDLYRFEYMDVEQLFDGEKVYLLVHEDEEVVIKNPNSEDSTTITPSKMMTFYENGFSYEMDITQNVKGKKIQYVKLTPMDSDSDLKYILLGIETATNHIYKVIETGIDDTITTYTILKFVTNQQIPDSLFTFDKKGFEDKGYDITEPK